MKPGDQIKLRSPKYMPPLQVRVVGAVTVYQVDHHGLDTSNNPSLIRARKPIACPASKPGFGKMVYTDGDVRPVRVGSVRAGQDQRKRTG